MTPSRSTRKAANSGLAAKQSQLRCDIPITALHGRRASKKATALFPAGTLPQLTPAQEERFKGRTMSERMNARLKDEFGGNTLRLRGAQKVRAHLMFGVLALTVDPWLRLSASG